VELPGVEPGSRDDFLYESTSQRTNAKITDSNEICKVKEDYFCSPALILLDFSN
jgi:type II secretory pathway component PulK